MAIGALAALGLLRQAAGHDPWSTLVGWRHWSEASQFAQLAWRGEEIEAEVRTLAAGRYRVVTAGGPVELAVLIRGQTRPAAGGQAEDGSDPARSARFRLDVEGEILEAIVVEGPRQLSVFAGGEAATFTLPDRLHEADEAGAGEDRLTAPMPGLVKVVATAAGAKVAKGEALIVVEAMKMEHTLIAPRDGEVAEVLVKAGEQVEDGALLVRLVESV